MKRLVLFVITCSLTCQSAARAADSKDAAKAKEALQALNDFIGSYKGIGTPQGQRPATKSDWREKLNWGWRFKGDDCWLRLDVENGKRLKSADLRYLVDKQRYQLKATAPDGQQTVFEGVLKDDYLTLEHTDPETKEVERLRMNMAGDGARFIYAMERKRPGRTIFTKDYRVECNKEGETFAAASNKIECIVTGGLGTMAVAYKGATYYVCCSGCRDAFLENPEKYIKEAAAKKKKK